MMGVFNNLVLFDQHMPQNRVESIVPDLATSWSLSEDATELMASLPTRAAMAERDFHGERRRNDSHGSTSDPEARQGKRGCVSWATR
jgi:hypothetical protein